MDDIERAKALEEWNSRDDPLGATLPDDQIVRAAGRLIDHYGINEDPVLTPAETVVVARLVLDRPA